MVKLKHPHIVQVYGLTVNIEMMMICEFVPGGQLNEYLQGKVKVQPMENVMKQMKCVCITVCLHLFR